MTTHVDQARAVSALGEIWERLDALLGELDDADWARPTNNPGWTVHDTVAHLVGTESMLLGEAPNVEIDRAAYPHVHNEIGVWNENWVEQMRPLSPAELHERFRAVTSRRRADLEEMDAERWSADGFTPAGQDTYGRFMRIRAFDCWLHEQDIRDAVGRPGGDEGLGAELALEEMASVMGYVIGKRAGAPAGSRVRLRLTGPAARDINVEVGERAAVVDELSGEPTVTLTMPAGVFARLGGGRVDPASLRSKIEIDGDAELGERIAANLAFTI